MEVYRCRRTSPLWRGLLPVLLFFPSMTQTVNADTLNWDGSNGTNWFSAPNWTNLTPPNNEKVPTRNDRATIFSGGTPLIDSPSGTAETDDLSVQSGATLNHTRGTLNVFGGMTVLGTVNFNLGTQFGSAVLDNKATQTSGNAITIVSGGVFNNNGGTHFGGSNELLNLFGTYRLNPGAGGDGSLDFDRIQIRTGGLLDWNGSTLATTDMLIRETGKWEIAGNYSYGELLTIQDTSEIELRDGGNLGTLTLTSPSQFVAFGGTIDGHLVELSRLDLWGEIDVLGTYSQSTSAFVTSVVDSATSSGSLSITGVANLAGDLLMSNTINYFSTASDGDSFTIMTASSLSGSFDRFTDSSAFSNSDLAFGLTYPSGGDSVVAIVGLIGDLNDDGFVGIEDLNIVLGNWNNNVTAGVWALGDPTGDGFIGIEDLNMVLGNWNAGTPPTASIVVPEPAGIMLSGVGVLGFVSRRGPTRHRHN